jgi:hypothetical protein
MNKATFPNGGFVLHKVATFNFENNGRATMSIWFDADGTLLDAERSLTAEPLSKLDKAKAN